MKPTSGRGRTREGGSGGFSSPLILDESGLGDHLLTADGGEGGMLALDGVFNSADAVGVDTRPASGSSIGRLKRKRSFKEFRAHLQTQLSVSEEEEEGASPSFKKSNGGAVDSKERGISTLAPACRGDERKKERQESEPSQPLKCREMASVASATSEVHNSLHSLRKEDATTLLPTAFPTAAAARTALSTVSSVSSTGSPAVVETEVAAVAAASPAALPEGWSVRFSTKHQRQYWFSSITGKSQWFPPTEK